MQPSNSFELEANGLHVIASEPNSSGMVSVDGASKVEVAALTGEFRVTNSRGLLLAKVGPGNALSFGELQVANPQIPTAATPTGPVKMTLYGIVSRVGDRYYLNLPAPDLGVVYEVRDINLDSFIGKRVVLGGTVDINAKPAGNAKYVLVARTVSEDLAPSPLTTKKNVVLSTLILGGAAGAAIGTYEASQYPTPASR